MKTETFKLNLPQNSLTIPTATASSSTGGATTSTSSLTKDSMPDLIGELKKLRKECSPKCKAQIDLVLHTLKHDVNSELKELHKQYQKGELSFHHEPETSFE